MSVHRQVVIALDDSRSMGESGCGGFACEAVVLLARALARLEVGSLGILRFGGAGAVQQLHPLDRPFTDADGPRILSHLRFDRVRMLTAVNVVCGHVRCLACHGQGRGQSLVCCRVGRQPDEACLVLVLVRRTAYEQRAVQSLTCTAGDVMWVPNKGASEDSGLVAGS